MNQSPTSVSTARPKLLAIAVAAALGTTMFPAQAVEIFAQGSTSIGLVTFSDPAGAPPGATTGNVDILDFRGDGTNNTGLHTFGNVGGLFGSRSSGGGVEWEATGLFSFMDTFTNDTTGNVDVKYNFTLLGGEVEVDGFSTEDGTFTDLITAGYSLVIAVDTITAFDSAVTITNTDGVIEGTESVPDSIGGTFSADESRYSYSSFDGMVDAGELAPGEFVTVTYVLETFSTGSISPTVTTCDDGGEPSGEPGDVIEPSAVGGSGCDSLVRFGDPFQGPNNPQPGHVDNQGNMGGFVITAVGVPEPGTLGLLGAGLVGLGAVARRARKDNKS